MQTIQDTMRYVHAQSDLRIPSNQVNTEKSSLLAITERVVACVHLFKSLPIGQRMTLSSQMQNFAKDYTKILSAEGRDEEERVIGLDTSTNKKFTATINFMRGVAHDIIDIAHSTVVDAPIEAPGYKLRQPRTIPETHRDKLKQLIQSQVESFFGEVSGSERETFCSKYDILNFANDILDVLMEKKERNPGGYVISPTNLKKELIEEASRKYSPLTRPAGEVFSEEEIEDVADEYYLAVEIEASELDNPDYNYQNFDQNLLEACLTRYIENTRSNEEIKPSQSWKQCPITHYRVGDTPEDFEEFKVLLEELTEFAVIKNVLKDLNSSMTSILDSSSDEEYVSSSDEEHNSDSEQNNFDKENVLPSDGEVVGIKIIVEDQEPEISE